MKHGSRTTRISNLSTVVAKSREHSGFGNLAWMIARASYMPVIYGGKPFAQNVIDAQNRVIASVGNAFPGPETDPYTQSPGQRGEDQVHFAQSFYNSLAQIWSQSLTDSFFSASAPSVP